jgi:hypothetical protein
LTKVVAVTMVVVVTMAAMAMQETMVMRAEIPLLAILPLGTRQLVSRDILVPQAKQWVLPPQGTVSLERQLELMMKALPDIPA